MAQNTRTELKNKFKRGMYPTEGDFANVFDSYVHKDDMVELEKVVQTIDNEQKTLATIINESKEEAIAAAVQQAGESEALTAIRNRLTTAEDDIDTDEDNISGHETRIQTLETSKSDYEAFKERVRAFLEDSDASDETINHWHEIESFLQGITDQETLTGLLADLKAEILELIPEQQQGNFVKQISDLDGYTEAQDGEIVQYVGQTTDSYTRGFFYERKEGEGGEEIQVTTAPLTIYANKMELFDGEDCGDIAGEYESVDTVLKYSDYGTNGYIINNPPIVGQKIVSSATRKITEYTDDYFYPSTIEEYFSDDMIHQGKWLYRRKTDGLLIAVLEPPIQSGSSATFAFIFVMADERNIKAIYKFKSGVYSFGKWGDVTTESISNQPSSWQHLHIDNVIS
ncbi:MAG: hypothetical protein II937_10580 [Bacteroidales bacterium]|nr:hypothetical protein [Bacteroidales bacterium]